MNRKLMIPGVALALAGVALTAEFDLTGPQFPDNPVEWLGWTAVLLGLFLMKLAATRET
ncbi:hypothetical protein [Halosimplex carlsbadense]|uniref:hypothetical protein n=1 Tax=Halosimplex carlsbadense TaxID=171164 RepID=UPI0013771E31|nr:hypothetical protein [Halosimplex carlsbadense]